MKTDLHMIAADIRRKTFEAIYNAGGGHYGGSLSAIEILTVLYFEIMHVDTENPRSDERDRFVLSKGHSGPALYTTLSVKGFFPYEDLADLDKPHSKFPKHVDRLKLDAIDVSTGALGQGLSIGAGMAYVLKMRRSPSRVFILTGDGELNSGQIWEAVMAGSKYKLDNLICIVDRNNLQIDGSGDEIMPLEPLEEKFRSFGWNVHDADGHDTQSLIQAVGNAMRSKGSPSVIIAKTIKGKGVSFMENKAQWHSGQVTEIEYCLARRELGCSE